MDIAMPAEVAVLRYDHESKGHAIKGTQNHSCAKLCPSQELHIYYSYITVGVGYLCYYMSLRRS